jgi:hypothetical protein
MLLVSDNSVENTEFSSNIDGMINTESGSSSNRIISTTNSNNVTIDSSELPLPLIFQGAYPLTAANVIMIYEEGTALYSPAYTWSSKRRTATWSDATVRKNNNNAYYGLCRDYTYLHANRQVRGDQKINTKLSRTNGKKPESIALDLMKENSLL